MDNKQWSERNVKLGDEFEWAGTEVRVVAALPKKVHVVFHTLGGGLSMPFMMYYHELGSRVKIADPIPPRHLAARFQ